VLSRLLSDAALAKQWRDRTRIDPNDSTALAQLLLAHALHTNAGGIVLFSTSKLANIRSNIKVVTGQPIGPEQVDGLDLLLSESEAKFRTR
jgi:D-threo-aldose 1-dehydrogenase